MLVLVGINSAIFVQLLPYTSCKVRTHKPLDPGMYHISTVGDMTHFWQKIKRLLN